MWNWLAKLLGKQPTIEPKPYYRLRYDDRRANGLCVTCKKEAPNKARRGKTQCSHCAQRQKEYDAKRRKKAKEESK